MAERTLDEQTARRIRRTPGIVIGILALLVLAVGLTAAVDLRRLKTPRGAALAWTEAATFGDCTAFRRLSVADALDPRTGDQVCRDLRRATATARGKRSRVSLRATSVVQTGATAVVTVTVAAPDGHRTVPLHLRRRGGAWLVERAPGACGEVSCY